MYAAVNLGSNGRFCLFLRSSRFLERAAADIRGDGMRIQEFGMADRSLTTKEPLRRESAERQALI
jgi:hypothetical protein